MFLLLAFLRLGRIAGASDPLDQILDDVSTLVNESLRAPESAEENLVSLLRIQTDAFSQRNFSFCRFPSASPRIVIFKMEIMAGLLRQAEQAIRGVASAHAYIMNMVNRAAFLSTQKSMGMFTPRLSLTLANFRGAAAVKESLEAHIQIFGNPKAVAVVQKSNLSFNFFEQKLDHLQAVLETGELRFGAYLESTMIKLLAWRAHLLRLSADRRDLLTPEMKSQWTRLEGLFRDYVPLLLVKQRNALDLPFWSKTSGLPKNDFWKSEQSEGLVVIMRMVIGDSSLAELVARCSSAAAVLLPGDLERKPTDELIFELSKELDEDMVEWSRRDTPDPELLWQAHVVDYSAIHAKYLARIQGRIF